MKSLYRMASLPGKWLFIALMAFTMQVHAATNQDSAALVTLKVSNAPIEDVFLRIEAQTGFSFTYSTQLIDKKEKVSVDFKREQLGDVLRELLGKRNLRWVIRGAGIVILQDSKPATQIERFSATDSIPAMTILKGTVTAEDGYPLPGATIAIKGTNRGTTTDNYGRFVLSNLPVMSVVGISYTGYELQEFNIKGSETVVVKMKRSVGTLDEQVVIAYGSSSKRLLTGNIARVTANEIEKQPINNPLQALQGRVSGLQITQTSGTPGGGFIVRLRGQNSISNGNDPLYIIDGVPYNSSPVTDASIAVPIFGGPDSRTNPLNYLNPADIASIEILKDADATAIYGSRGANGVVLITTKQGAVGKSKLDINLYSGTGRVTRMMQLLSTRQYLDMRYEAFKNDGIDLNNPAANAPDLKQWDTTRYTNWQKELIGGNASITNAQLALSGGTEQTQFRLGGGYFKETSVYPGSFSDRKTSVNFNLRHRSVDKKLSLQFSANFLNDINTLPNNDLTTSALTLPPVAPALFTSQGLLNWEGSSWTNPARSLFSKYEAKANNLVGNATLNYEIVKNLTARLSLGYTNTSIKETNLVPRRAQDPSTAGLSTGQFATNMVTSWIAEPQLEFTKNIALGKLNILVGATFQQNVSEALRQTGRGFSSDDLIENLQAAQTVTINFYDHRIYHYAASFGRINYNVQNKYILNLTGRRDGSSRFGPGKQFANFGSVGAAWIFSEEHAFKKTLAFISFGKIRASYGTTGNDQLADYQFLSTYTPTTAQYQGAGLSPTSLFNPDFRWEENRKFEVALDFGFLNDRIFTSVNVYRNRSSNQLVGYPLAPTTGFSTVQFNLPATVQNTGLELELSTTNLKRRDFIWSTSFNLTLPKNKLVSYPNLKSSSDGSRYVVGQPLTIVKGYKYMGIDVQSGIYTFKDYNEDGMLSVVGDRENVINTSQRYFGGLLNKISFKGFNLDFLVQFAKQIGRNYITVMGFQPGFLSNQPTTVLNRWTKVGDNAEFQKYSQGLSTPFSAYNRYGTSEAGYTDASFIRLKNVSFSYSLSKPIVEKIKIQQCRIFIQGQNLLTFTNFLGLDPENNSFSSLPPLRMITAGLSVGF